MELTGKCKQDFEKWLISFFREKRTDYNNLFTDESILRKFYRKTDVEKNALIIEFFDSVEIYIDTWYYDGFCWQVDCYLLEESAKYNEAKNSRPEAQTEAIKKAIEIYNENY